MKGAVWATVAVLCLLGGGCRQNDRAEEAARRFVAAARAGDRAGLYRTLGPKSRARLASLAEIANRSGVRQIFAPEDLLSLGWTRPAWQPVGVRLVRREKTEAQAEVYAATGERHALKLVKEKDQWKVELPALASPVHPDLGTGAAPSEPASL